MKNTPINYEVVSRKIKESRIENIGKATIRELKKLVDDIEKETSEKFIRMEMGIPGLPAADIGVNAEIEALKKGIANIGKLGGASWFRLGDQTKCGTLAIG